MDIFSFNIGLSLLSSAQADRKALSAEGRRVLSLLDGRPVSESDFLKEENGRPYFPDRHCDFNISHSGSIAAVSRVTGGYRTGCDIQRVHLRENTLRIAEKYFSPGENDYILNDKKRFFEIWTLKECYLKLRGLSVFDMERSPSFVKDGHLRLSFESGLSFYLYEITGNEDAYILASALQGDAEAEPEISWFSDAHPIRVFPR
jgi:phosphopantetheinyl transferase